MENNKNVKGPNKGEMDLREKVDVDVKELSMEELDQVYGGYDVREGMNLMAGRNEKRRKDP